MLDREQMLKKIYGETASLIVDCGLRGNYDEIQMRFLLNLLELSVVKKQRPELFVFLQKWMNSYTDSENDRIIEATLLAMDISDDKSWPENMRLISELIDEENI